MAPCVLWKVWRICWKERHIRELRKQNKLTVEQVRDYLGLESTQSIYNWQAYYMMYYYAEIMTEV